jgi:hypothetical protein
VVAVIRAGGGFQLLRLRRYGPDCDGLRRLHHRCHQLHPHGHRCEPYALSFSFIITEPADVAVTGKQVTALDTTFIFNDAGGCYSNFESDFNPGQAATMSGCFQLCRFFPVTYASPLTASGSFDCRCSNTLFTGTTPALVCGRGTWFGFSHSPDATVSGLARRHAARARLVEAAKKNTKCPNGLAACPVLGWDSYEVGHYDDERALR